MVTEPLSRELKPETMKGCSQRSLFEQAFSRGVETFLRQNRMHIAAAPHPTCVLRESLAVFVEFTFILFFMKGHITFYKSIECGAINAVDRTWGGLVVAWALADYIKD